MEYHILKEYLIYVYTHVTGKLMTIITKNNTVENGHI